MPITYAERKKRRQALLQQLVPELRERLALRHVEAVAKLSLEAQRTLAGAIMAGLLCIPDAIACLQDQPDASVEDVLRVCQDESSASFGQARLPRTETAPSVSKADLFWLSVEPESDALTELAGVLQESFPGMPAMTARALAADELLSDALALVHVQQTCFHSKSIQSELVFVALCGLGLRFIDELSRLMDSRPHYRGALEQSGLRNKWSSGQIAG